MDGNLGEVFVGGSLNSNLAGDERGSSKLRNGRNIAGVTTGGDGFFGTLARIFHSGGKKLAKSAVKTATAEVVQDNNRKDFANAKV